MNQKVAESTKEGELGELVAILSDEYMWMYHFEEETIFVELDEDKNGTQEYSEYIPVIDRIVYNLENNDDDVVWKNDNWDQEIVLGNI